MSKLLEVLGAERAVLVGALGSIVVAVAGHYDIVLDEASLNQVLLPLLTGVVTRVFVTSKGVKPGL